MHPLQKFENNILSVIRMDLQLHFFWSFSLTMLAFFWTPFIISGVIITVGKEVLDVIAQKGWSWGDFFFGMTGAVAGILFLWFAGYFHQF